MAYSDAWVEAIEGYPGFFRLCLQSGDVQVRQVINVPQLDQLSQSIQDARVADRARRDA